MIFARFKSESGMVWITEGLDTDVALSELRDLCEEPLDFDAITFWEARKLNVRVETKVITVKY